MSRLLILFFLILTSPFFFAQNKHSERCGTSKHEQKLQRLYPQRLSDVEFESWLNPLVKKQLLSRSESGGVITIPVVVHVAHSGQNVGVGTNLDDQQIISQITVLNNDFRKIIGTPGYNTSPVGVDTKIQFALAKVDPKGNPTNGIDRVYYNHDKWTDDQIETILKPQTIWDTGLYLNLWSVDFADADALGYAQFPDASGLSGLDPSGGLGTTDGVVSKYTSFGSREIYPNGVYSGTQYDKGRTMTHEVGHWLGLRHIWGDSTCGDDFCPDTPTAHGANYGCPTVLSCANVGNEMVENYMDYTDDACMNIFTQDQLNRMQVIINNAPRRLTLKTSQMDKPIDLLANDVEVKIERIFVTVSNKCSVSSVLNSRKISLINRGTNDISSVRIGYTINSGTEQEYNWSGVLKPDGYASIDLNFSALPNDVLHVSVKSVNGGVDSRTTNDIASAVIEAVEAPESYGFRKLLFRLQLDQSGSEITWSLKNSADTVLFSGGPYANTSGNLPDLISHTWEMKDNECYTFTINDSYGDGVCCTEGEGFYELSYDSGVLLRSGNFGFSEEKSFSISFDSNEVSEGVILLGNPIDGELSFIVDANFGPHIVVDVFNTAGAKIYTEKLSDPSQITRDFYGLQAGVYFLKVTSDTQSKVLRFLKK